MYISLSLALWHLWERQRWIQLCTSRPIIQFLRNYKIKFHETNRTFSNEKSKNRHKATSVKRSSLTFRSLAPFSNFGSSSRFRSFREKSVGVYRSRAKSLQSRHCVYMLDWSLFGLTDLFSCVCFSVSAPILRFFLVRFLVRFIIISIFCFARINGFLLLVSSIFGLFFSF